MNLFDVYPLWDIEPVKGSGTTLWDKNGEVYTDLYGGHEPTLAASLRRLATLPEGTAVYPGHGPATTVSREKKYNPYMMTE